MKIGLKPLLRYWRRFVAGGTLILGMLIMLGIGIAVSRAHLSEPEVSVLLRDRHGDFLGEVGGSEEGGFGYWPVEVLPERVIAATLAIEDRRFWEHPGVDARAVVRAAHQNMTGGRRISGASTLAMQLARMQHPGSRSYFNKALEAMTSLVLTSRVGRVEVLRHYLRIVPYGNRIHGIAYAARRYLDKPVIDLSWAEVAFLVAIPQAPARMNPFTSDGRRQAIARGIRILGILKNTGVLSCTEYELAIEQIKTLRIPLRGERPDEAMHYVLAMEQLFADQQQFVQISQRPCVITSLDLELQREASWQLLESISSWDHLGAGNGALIVLDRASFEVLAWVGSTDYFDQRHKGAIDYVRIPRSPGSTLKPFLYAFALENQIITPADILDDLDRGAGGIGNADESFFGPLLPRMALANSRNVPAANLLDAIGLDDGYRFLNDLGLHKNTRDARHWGLGLAIGSMPVTLEALVRAYSVFLNDGELGQLRWYDRQPQEPSRRLLSESVARQITLFLADPMARLPAFERMGSLEYPFPVAIKTGTSSNYHDAWAVAWSRKYLVAAWVGHPDFRPMNRLSGSRSAARLVKRVMTGLHSDQLDGLDDVGFPPPRSSSPVMLCALTGTRASNACDRQQLEYFAKGEEPIMRCEAHQRLMVDRNTGELATFRSASADITTRTFTDLGPRYAQWQVNAGLPYPPAASSRPQLTQLRPSQISITTPRPSMRVLRDPEAPPGRSTLALSVTVDPPTKQIVWYVDGEPWMISDYPYTARWPLKTGEHTFQARTPFTNSRSQLVSIEVF